MNETQAQQSLPVQEKAAYGVLAFGRNLAGQMISLFLMIFYTDIFGIPVHYISLMFLVFSLWEGCSKQLAGFFMGKTETRHGKYRPYLLWLTVPYAVFSVLIFIAPNLSDANKVLYAYCTYFIWSLLGNTISIAHNAIMPVMTRDLLERTQINSLKIIFSVLASLIVSSFGLKLVDVAGRGDQKAGFILTVLGMSVITVIIQVFSYKNLRERHSVAEKEKISVKTAVRGILDTRVLLFFLVYCTLWIGNTFKNSSTPYFFKYVLDQPDLIGTFFMIGTTASFVMHFFVKRIVTYIKAEQVMLVGIAGSLIGLLIIFTANSNLGVLYFGNIVFGLMSALPANLAYLVLAGHVDEKNDQYKTSLGSWLYAGMDNLAKIGIGLGNAVFSGLLSITGYEPNLQQGSTALSGIRFGFYGGSTIAYLACLILMGSYILVCKRKGEIQN